MSSSAKIRPRFTRAEYHAREKRTGEKFEFIDGEIVAMAGASMEHVLLADNLHAALRARFLPKGCRPYSSDIYLDVDTGSTERTFHPDVTVVCGRPIRVGPALTNPSILCEVSSSSTVTYDRETKIPLYKTIPSLRAILIVSQERPEIIAYTRPDERERWSLQTYVANEAVEIGPLNVKIPLAEVYEGWADLQAR